MLKRNWFAIVTLLLAVLGVGLAVWYGSKSKKPVYAISGTSLATSSISKYGNLKLIFNDKPVPQATVTNILLWNAGRETIRRDDIAPGDPIRVSLHNEAKLLSCKILRSGRKVTAAKLNATNGRITFDFLDGGDWVLLQALHTGDKPEDCSVAGTIMGCRQGLRKAGVRDRADTALMLFGVLYIPLLVVFPFFAFPGRGHRPPMLHRLDNMPVFWSTALWSVFLFGIPGIAAVAMYYWGTDLPGAILPR